ncbi:Ger(x)C family spore germination protein [Ureibacillus aquaedulcis]|uniref:Ger(X)C family spore germination protein n=1 Tax=Ureibacillus aquaedulcis TaxID=3058421 RepID=A0ABT8GVW8_9BACL|nr:Ger(x)C family spore germination protein [Ureibacillus sp. BA0131]MDN4495555.1 Ger(x)C family spore germination protein [Ureibacillus sp. BA0131]
MIKILYRFPYLFLLLFLLSGCWDQTNIDKRAYVVAIGLDKAEEDQQYKVTYLISNPELSKQQAGTNEPGKEILTFSTNDLMTAKKLANTVVAKEISYNLLTVLVVSEDLARDKFFLRLIYDSIKSRDIARDTPIIVSKENASKFLIENEPKLETRIHKYFELIMESGSESGFIPKSTLHSFFRITEADADLFLAPYGTTEKSDNKKDILNDDFLAGEFQVEGETNKTQLIGSALFKEGEMIAKLTAKETRIAVLLNDTLDMGELLTTYPDPNNEDYRLGVRVMKKEGNKVNMNLKQTIPSIDVEIPIRVDILANHGMKNYSKDSPEREELKKYLEEQMTKEISHFVKKTQEDFKGEPFGWSLTARKQFKTTHEYEAFDFMKNYPSMNVKVKVSIEFGNFGRQSEMPSIGEMRD